ncbi:transmembrane protein 161B-like [Mercenaria mercenaria]|uniref:transmembrane protein 161B-like n=1 Tax=Mercenaria mercenaria TaxID=6596 RepID=UPI00234EBF37|nr:transmembrane protein 161B-like [Mercenaria mercenaria]
MAVLGAQLVFSLIVFSFLQKLSSFYSFGRWLLAGRLVRYLHPSDEELKKAAGIQSNGNLKGKGKRHDTRKGANNKEVKEETFTIPRSTPISLDTTKVEAIDLIHLHYYEEYLWIVDFALSAVIVYTLTEIYYMFGHANEMNISIIWCLLAIGFCTRILISQTVAYFKAEDGGERILIVTFGFFCLVLAMGVLVVDENVLEFGLGAGYKNFSDGATLLLQKEGVESAGPVHFLTFKIILAFVCAIIGALMTFPGLRMSKLHLDSLKYSKENPAKQILLHLNFILPYVILFLWIKPIGRDILCGLNWRITTKVFSESVFDNFRIVTFAVMCILRLMLLPTHVQSHLNSAYEKVESIRKESGRISNIEIKKMVARVFYFVSVVVIQYVVPVIILLFMAFLYKTLGDYSWSGTFGETAENYINSFRKEPTVSNITSSTNKTRTMLDEAENLSVAFSDLRAVFTPLFYRGILSFLTWWICASWTLAMTFGLYYHTRAEA